MGSKRFNIECSRYITDFRGHEISPGNIVAVSRSGRGSRRLEAYIVTAVRRTTISYAGVKYKVNYGKDSAGKMTYERVVSGVSPGISRSELFPGEIQQHLVVIENPLYAIENPQMEEIIRVADMLKDEGIFPSDYKLGQSVMEFKEE